MLLLQQITHMINGAQLQAETHFPLLESSEEEHAT